MQMAKKKKPRMLSEEEFYKEVDNIPGISKSMTDAGPVYTLDKVEIKKFLQNSNNPTSDINMFLADFCGL